MTPMISFYQFIGVYIFCRFPRVVCRWIAFPFDQILELASTPIAPVVLDRFDFILFSVLD